jgi:glutamine synthetase
MFMEEEKQKVIEEIKQKLTKQEVKHIYLNFMDYSGNILSKMVGVKELIRNTHVSWLDGISLNGSLIEDFHLPSVHSDWLVLLPDPTSFRLLPFLTGDQKAASIFCSIKEFALDTRNLLAKVVNEFLAREITPMVGTQLIYSLSQEERDEKQNFYATLATNPDTLFNHELVNDLLAADIDIEYYLPYGKKHQRIDLVPDIATMAADKLLMARWFASNMARQKGYLLEWENLPEDNLSTCPLHLSLWKGKREKNLFFDETQENELSELARNFISGILTHQKAIKALAKSSTKYPLKNYQTAYSTKRDNSLIQVPLYFQETQKKDRIGWSKRCIYQGFNADQNIYLGLAAILYAGLDGISTHQEKKNANQNRLPKENKIVQESHEELVQALKEDTYLTEKLGESIIQKAIQKLGGRKA